jgi:hypothetical protein
MARHSCVRSLQKLSLSEVDISPKRIRVLRDITTKEVSKVFQGKHSYIPRFSKENIAIFHKRGFLGKPWNITMYFKVFHIAMLSVKILS